MEVHTDSGPSVWAVILILALLVLGGLAMLGLGATGSLNIGAPRPAQYAKATQIALEAEADYQARQVEIERQRAAAELENQAEQAALPQRIIQRQTLYLGTALIMVLTVLWVGAVLGASATVRLKKAALPQPVEVAPQIYVLPGPAGPILLDALTGSRALLSDPAGVDRLRLGAAERLQIADRAFTAAERIAATSRSPQPADWLHQIVEAVGPAGSPQGAEITRPLAAPRPRPLQGDVIDADETRPGQNHRQG